MRLLTTACTLLLSLTAIGQDLGIWSLINNKIWGNSEVQVQESLYFFEGANGQKTCEIIRYGSGVHIAEKNTFYVATDNYKVYFYIENDSTENRKKIDRLTLTLKKKTRLQTLDGKRTYVNYGSDSEHRLNYVNRFQNETEQKLE